MNDMAENQTAYSYQAPDQYIYNLLTGGGNRFGLLLNNTNPLFNSLANIEPIIYPLDSTTPI